MHALRFVPLAVSMLALLIPLFPAQAADDGIPAGCHKMTAAEAQTAREGGDTTAEEGRLTCQVDQKAFTDDTAAAKKFLRSILCKADGDNYGGYGPDATIAKLDNKFSTCAAKFLKSARQDGIPVCIREGARTVEKQNAYAARGVIACKKGAACEHPRGIAIDVNTATDQQYARLHASARNFGLVFYLGFRDKYHFVPASAKKGGGTSDCSGGGTIEPDYPSYYQGYSGNSNAPLGLGDLFRQATQAPQPLPPQPTLPQQQSSASYFPTQSTPASTGSTQTTGTAQTTGTSQTIGTASGGTSAATPSADTKPTVADQLLALTFSTSSPTGKSTTIATIVPIAIDGNDRGGVSDTLAQNTARRVQTGTSSSQSLTPASYYPQQTFSSQDISWRPTTGSYTGITGTQATLQYMKETLLKILDYLKPFGGGERLPEIGD